MSRKLRDDPFAALADNLTYYRRKQHVTREILAERLGLRVDVIEQIESGERKVTMPTLARLATALGVSTQQLIR
ncbi:MAG: helix-turn-helix transcriptional regulator [Phycisphaerae bacterium]|nr:helix-turn-helix transcriptional regulator [Phycisphaerae bacterium]